MREGSVDEARSGSKIGDHLSVREMEQVGDGELLQMREKGGGGQREERGRGGREREKSTHISGDVLLLREDDLVGSELGSESSGESGDLLLVGGESFPAAEMKGKGESARRVERFVEQRIEGKRELTA